MRGERRSVGRRHGDGRSGGERPIFGTARFAGVKALVLSAAAVALAGARWTSAAPKNPPRPKRSAKPAPRPVGAGRPGPMLKKFLAGPMRDVDEIVFAVRVPGRDHWYVTFGNYADHSRDPKARGFRFEEGVYWGYADYGRLCKLNLRTGRMTVLLDDPKGGVRDPQVHYSGKRILFSYRKGGTRTFHLYEINVDGTGLRQLTRGEDDDIEPTYLPDGSILFCSSRCKRFVNCWFTRVAVLYRCDADGQNVRMLSSNLDHDNTPWVLPDGRVLYMRWEYVDRSQVHYHHLWTTNPDGTNQTVFYGNLHPGIAMLDAKPIPGTVKVVASFSPGHGRPEHLGHVTVVDPRGGPDDLGRAKRISKQSHWKDPYAFSEECFLAASRGGIYAMDGAGRQELVYALPANQSRNREGLRLECHEPRPIRPRPVEPVIASRVDLAEPTGRMFLQDIYAGRNMAGVKRGEIKKLLVLEQVPKPVNFSGGMQPLTIGGSFTIARIVGTVPVEPDGSCFMEVPALRSLFFVALDKKDLSVKRMHSFVTVQPGETIGCVGCHEKRVEAPRPDLRLLAGAGGQPRKVEMIENVPHVIDFPRDVQPILDRHCVKCHNAEKYAAKMDLSGHHTPTYSISYWAMNRRGLFKDNRNRPVSNLPPRSVGSSASKLMRIVDGHHNKVQLSADERRIIRLWIDTSATYPGTYAALGCGSYPVAPPALGKRCGSCHKRRFGQYGHIGAICNLDVPEKSLLLRAPLARKAGGLQLCKKPIFASRKDPDYRAMLAALQGGHRRLQAGKRFDMPGFRPNRHYIREMQRFGILPADLPGDVPVDPYKTDAAYWKSFWWMPQKQVGAR